MEYVEIAKVAVRGSVHNFVSSFKRVRVVISEMPEISYIFVLISGALPTALRAIGKTPLLLRPKEVPLAGQQPSVFLPLLFSDKSSAFLFTDSS